MSEELIQKGYTEHGEIFGIYEFYNIGNTTINELKRFKIAPDKEYGDYGIKKPDALLVDRRNKDNVIVIAVIEHKDYSEFNTPYKKELACKQCNNYCEVLNAKIGIVTDTNEYIWINPQKETELAEIKYVDSFGIRRGFDYILKEDGYPLSNAFILDVTNKTETQKTLRLIDKILKSINKYDSRLEKEKKLNPSNLAKQVWQAIWLASGENPDKCLATFVEIFLFKFLSDLGVLTKNKSGVPISFDDILKSGKKYCLKYYFDNVRSYIKEIFPSNKKDGTSVINDFILNPEIKEHNALFYNILIKFKEFLRRNEHYEKLENIEPEFKTRLYEDFLKRSISQKNWGQFFTPRNVVKAIIEMSDIEHLPEGSKVCDPACGVGGFILEPILTKRTSDYYFEYDKLKRKIEYIGFDRDPKTIILAKANMLIYLSDLLKDNPTLTHEFANMLNKTFISCHRSILGSLSFYFENTYDLIMTNPPYVTKGISNYKDAIKENGKLKKFYTTNAMGTEGFFLQKIIKELKPKGRAFVIVPDGTLNRLNDDKLRKFIRDNCIIDGIISLPQGTFYTTLRKTYILCLTKKEDKSIEQTDPVFTYLVTNIGETLDVYRAEIPQNDLKDMVKQFKYFMVNKKDFDSLNLRCKVFPIEKFAPQSHWCVDRWWSKEEKIKLGIEERREVINVDEFYSELKLINEELEKVMKEIEKLKEFTTTTTGEFKFKNEKLTDLFEIKQGNSFYTKKRIIENKWEGDIPVYSSNTKNNGLLIKIHEKWIKEEDKYYNYCLTWAIDGDAGTIFIRNPDNKENKKEKRFLFTANNHCGILIPKTQDLDLEYVKVVLQPIFYQKTKCYNNKKLGTNQITDIEIPIPIKDDGSYDIDKQREIAEKYRKLEEIKNNLIKRLEELKEIEVSID
ncbi:MAG TPA: N-6 DNA methylase [Thermoplasmata archaeon]|nr:N-6 DNA methylase [Thermoplasmata archaeon]